MKWLVCGGRDFGNIPNTKLGVFVSLEFIDQKKKEYQFIFSELDALAHRFVPRYPSEEVQLPEGIEIISGMAKGVDTVAIDWAVVNWLKWYEYPADWEKYSKRAGYLRNVQMLEEGRPDLVVCFPGGHGTEMMFNLARKAGVHVIRYLDMLTKEEHNENQ